MRKLNYFIVGLSQLIMGTMTIGFVSCEQNLEALDNSPQMAEAMVGSKSITSVSYTHLTLPTIRLV